MANTTINLGDLTRPQATVLKKVLNMALPYLEDYPRDHKTASELHQLVRGRLKGK